MRFYSHTDLKSDWPKYRTKFAWTPVKIFGQYRGGIGQMGEVWLETYSLKQYEKGGKWFPELR